MKRYIVISAVLLLLITGITGCGNSPVPPGEETSSCVICHSDKEMLQQTATVEEEKTGEISGEG